MILKIITLKKQIYDNIPFYQQESIKKSTVPNHPPSRYLFMISIQKWNDSLKSLCGWKCQMRLLEPVFEFWRVKGIVLAVGFLGKISAEMALLVI